MSEDHNETKRTQNDAADSELEQIRALLLSRYQRKVNDLNSEWQDGELFKQRVDVSLHQIFEPQDQNRQKISFRMQNSLVESLGIASNTQPIRLAKSLAPVIGPAITASITRALAEFRQTIDEMLLHSVSPKGLYWRYLAKKTGEPFSRIVQRKTKDFGVESVFLVHKISHVVVTEQHGSKIAEDQLQLNKEYMSSKLAELAEVSNVTANAFELEPTELYLRDGKVPALMCYGQYLNLLCIHWGEASEVFKTRIFSLLQSIHKQYAQDLKNYHRGDTDLEALAMPVQQLFVDEQEEPEKPVKVEAEKNNRAKWWVAALFIVFCLGLYGYLQHAWESADLKHSLASNPHVFVHDMHSEEGKWKIKLIADPSVFDAKKFAEQWRLNMPHAKSLDIEVQPVISLHPQAVETRANQILKPPKGLSLDVDEQRVIHVQGKGYAAHQAWLEAAERDWSKVVGATALTTKNVIRDWPDEMVLPIFEKYFISMEQETNLKDEGAVELRLLLAKVRVLKDKQLKQKLHLNVGVIGLSPLQDGMQETLRQRRAQMVTDALLNAGVDSAEIYTLTTTTRYLSRKGVLVHLRADVK